jgi:RNA-dependent RNA polymerase
VATNWLLTADQSDDLGVFDPDCLALSELHSVAVDYQKHGNAVDLKAIPRLKFRARPDWNAPETVTKEASTKYYPSERAIGKRVEVPLGCSIAC